MGWTSAVKKTAPATTAALKPKATAVFSFPLIPFKIDLAKVVTVDYETYYDTDYTLRKMNTSEYVRDPRFKAHMVGIKVGKRATKVYPHKEVERALKAIDWGTHYLLCHHTQFDGFIMSHHHGITPHFCLDTLSMARALHSNEIGVSLDEVAQFYGKGNKLPNILEQMKGVRDLPPALYKKGAAYCARDMDLTFEIFVEMLPKMPAAEIRLIDHTIQMFTNPVLKVDVPIVAKEHAREVAHKESMLLSMLGTEKQVAKLMKEATFSNTERRELGDTATTRDLLIYRARKLIGGGQFADLLRAEGVDPPMKISPAWFKHKDDSKKYAYAFAKTDLAFTALQEHPNKKVRDLVECRLSVKSSIGETRAVRFMEAGKNGLPLPVYLKFYGAHCVTGDVEVLTPEGWQRIDQWDGGTIAQVREDQSISFLPATRFVGPTAMDWLEVDAPYLKGAFTLGHTMPYLRHGSMAWATAKAGEFDDASSRYVPLAGRLDGTGQLNAAQMRVLAMVQADGSFETNPAIGRRLAIFVKKPRKIERARQLLRSAGVAFEEQVYDSWPGYVRFIVRSRDYPAWLQGRRKYFGPWLLDSTAEAREALLDELQHWDGWVQGGQHCFSTSVRSNAEWIQTLCHLTGRCASIHEKPQRSNRTTNYVVAIRQRSFGMVKREHMVRNVKPQATFCTETQTGFWLARSQGRIFVTGNTGRWSAGNKMNMQNLPRENPDDPDNSGILRKSILAPKGHVIVVADSGQIEARVNGWLWGQDDLMDGFRLADAGKDRDVYCKFADTVYGREITKKDKLERFVGKIAVLGLGYQMGAAKFQNTLALGTMGPAVFIDQSLAQQIVNAYRRKNHRIAAGWRFLSDTVLPDMARGREGEYKCLTWGKEFIQLPNGMRLKYPKLKCENNGQWDEWSYERKGDRAKIYGGLMCENIVQALARIIVGEQLLTIGEKYRVVTTTHDEIVTIAKTREGKKCYDFMHKVMMTPPQWCADIPLSAEGGFAVNYSK